MADAAHNFQRMLAQAAHDVHMDLVAAKARSDQRALDYLNGRLAAIREMQDMVSIDADGTR